MKISIYSLALLGLFFLSACEGRKVSEMTSKIRFINASSISGDINVYIDYKKMYATDIQYLNYSKFSDHISQVHVIELKTAAGSLIVDTSLDMKYNKVYTGALYDQSGQVKFMLYEEDMTTPVGSFCKMRFLHFSNNAPAVDITAENDTTVLFRNYKNGDRSEYVYFGIDSVHLQAHDTGNPVPFYKQYWGFKPKAGNFYTVYLKGNIGSTGIDSLGFGIVENNGNYE